VSNNIFFDFVPGRNLFYKESAPFLDAEYEALRQESIKEFEAVNNSAIAAESLEFSLSNTSKETDYAAWSAGSAQFANDNYDALKRWLS
jgi:hypothetical protein